MVAPKPSNGYSAHVQLELRVGEARFPLAQIANDRIILDHAMVLPGTTGEVLAIIDSKERRWMATWVESETPRQVVLAQFRDA
jgi:hypothetical protein